MPLHAVLLMLLSAASASGPAAPAPDARARAEALYNQGLGSPPETRIRLLTEAVRLCPEDARYWVALGDAYAIPVRPNPPREGQDPGEAVPTSLDQARRIYEQAVRFAPKSALPHLRLAEVAWETNRAQAGAHLDRAAELDPDNALPVYLRATLHFLADEPEKACRLVMEARKRPAIRLPMLLPTADLTVVEASACLAGVQMQSVARLRELARRLAATASSRPGAPAGDLPDARALLIEGQRLAYRTMAAEPKSAINLLAGIAIDAVVTNALDEVLRAQADADGLLRLQQRQEARNALRDRARDRIKELTDRLMRMVSQPGARIRVLEDEGKMVETLLKESGLRETMDG